MHIYMYLERGCIQHIYTYIYIHIYIYIYIYIYLQHAAKWWLCNLPELRFIGGGSALFPSEGGSQKNRFQDGKLIRSSQYCNNSKCKRTLQNNTNPTTRQPIILPYKPYNRHCATIATLCDNSMNGIFDKSTVVGYIG